MYRLDARAGRGIFSPATCPSPTPHIRCLLPSYKRCGRRLFPGGLELASAAGPTTRVACPRGTSAITPTEKSRLSPTGRAALCSRRPPAVQGIAAPRKTSFDSATCIYAGITSTPLCAASATEASGPTDRDRHGSLALRVPRLRGARVPRTRYSCRSQQEEPGMTHGRACCCSAGAATCAGAESRLGSRKSCRGVAAGCSQLCRRYERGRPFRAGACVRRSRRRGRCSQPGLNGSDLALGRHLGGCSDHDSSARRRCAS
jgi:hypothetical protein